MLVVTRRQGEEIVVGDPAKPFATIKISKIQYDRVTVSLDFPKEMPVHRKEVAAAIVKEGKST